MLRRNDSARAVPVLGKGPPVNPGGMDAGNLGQDGGAGLGVTITELVDDLGGLGASRQIAHGVENCAFRNFSSSGKCVYRNLPTLRIPQNWVMDAAWLRKHFEEHPEKTQKGLAKALGNYDPSIVNRMLKDKSDGGRGIKATEVPKIEAYFGVSSRAAGVPIAEMLRPANAWPVSSGPDIPVLGRAEGGPDGVIDWNGDVVDRRPRPPFLEGATDPYAVYVNGSSMEDRYYDGELVYVHPGRPVVTGCFVVVQFRREGGGDPAALVKQYLKRDGKHLLLRQFNPAKEIKIPLERLVSVHRIVGSGES